MDLRPHLRICNDSYELIAKADSGGFGSVWQARNLALNKVVALKFLLHSDPASIRESLRSEGQKMARVAGQGTYSRNIVYAHHFFPGDEKTPPFLELEWVDDGNLTRMLAAHGTLPVPELLRVALDVAGALATAHRLELIHCDIKPSNILHSQEGVFKLSDFGLSRLMNSGGSKVPHGGTLPYMSPEQFQSRSTLTPATDIYSFGCVLFQCCEGHAPYGEPGWTWPQFENAHRELPAPSLRNPAVPPELARLINECMRKAARHRPGTDDVLAQLERIVQQLPGSVTTRAAPPALGGPAREMTLVRVGREPDRCLHPACDLEFVKLEDPNRPGDAPLFLPNRLVSNRDFLLFLRAAANRVWQPSLIAARQHDGGYLSSWTRDLPSVDKAGNPLHSIPHVVATTFAEWLGGRLPSRAQLARALAHPHAETLRGQIAAHLRASGLDFVQFWCAAESSGAAHVPMLLYPDNSRLAPHLGPVNRPAHFCLSHYLFLPVITAADVEEQFVVHELGDQIVTGQTHSEPTVDIEKDMEAFIEQFLSSASSQ